MIKKSILGLFVYLSLFGGHSAYSASDASLIAVEKNGGGLYQVTTGQSQQATKLADTGPEPHETAISPNGRLIVVSSPDFNVKKSKAHSYEVTVYDRFAKKRRAFKLKQQKNPHGIAFIDDSRMVVSTEGSADAWMFDLSTGQQSRLDFSPYHCHLVKKHPNKPLLYASCRDNNALIEYDLTSQSISRVWPSLPGVESFVLDKSGQWLWMALHGNNTLVKLKLKNGKLSQAEKLSYFPIRLRLSHDQSELLVLGMDDGRVHQHNAQSLKAVASTKLPGGHKAEPISITALGFNHFVISDSANHLLHWYDANTHQITKSVSLLDTADGLNKLSTLPPQMGRVTELSHFKSPLAHEGPVVLGQELLFFSQPIAKDGRLQILTHRLNLKHKTMARLKIPAQVLPMPNGACREDKDHLLIAAQGDLENKAGIYRLTISTQSVEPLVTEAQGKPFNSPNDLVCGHNELWFTDPDYGYIQHFRHSPQQSVAVWHFDSKRHRLTRLTTQIKKPNGIAISPDGKLLFVSDSSYFRGDGRVDHDGYRQVTAYRLHRDQSKRPYLGKILWQHKVYQGIPDGIKLSPQGTLIVATGMGLLELSLDKGETIRYQKVDNGVVNFAIDGGSYYLLSDKRIYQLT